MLGKSAGRSKAQGKDLGDFVPTGLSPRPNYNPSMFGVSAGRSEAQGIDLGGFAPICRNHRLNYYPSFGLPILACSIKGYIGVKKGWEYGLSDM